MLTRREDGREDTRWFLTTPSAGGARDEGKQKPCTGWRAGAGGTRVKGTEARWPPQAPGGARGGPTSAAGPLGTEKLARCAGNRPHGREEGRGAERGRRWGNPATPLPEGRGGAARGQRRGRSEGFQEALHPGREQPVPCIPLSLSSPGNWRRKEGYRWALGLFPAPLADMAADELSQTEPARVSRRSGGGDTSAFPPRLPLRTPPGWAARDRGAQSASG